MKKITLLIGILIMMQQVEAIKWDSGIMNSDGLDLNIDINNELFMDKVIIAGDSIYIERLRSTDGGVETITMNTTETTSDYKGSDLPYFYFTSDYEKVIATNMTKNMTNSTIVARLIMFNCDDLERITYTSGAGTQYVYDGADAQAICLAKEITLSQVDIEDVYNIIKIKLFSKNLSEREEQVYPLIMLVSILSIAMFKKNGKEELNTGEDKPETET